MKHIAKKTLSTFAQLLPIDNFVRVSGQGLILPMYHTVSENDLPHLKHLYPVISVKRFMEDIDFLSANFNAVNYDYVLHCTENLEYRKEKAFFLTFDDGLREFHDVVAPILLEKGIPAVCFVNPAYVDNKAMFYRMKFSILKEKISFKKLTKAQFDKIAEIFQSHGLMYKSEQDLLNVGDKDKEIAEKIANIIDVDFSEYLKEHQPYMTHSQIQNIIDKGFTIGAHSMTHPYFPNLSEENQLLEAIESIKWVKTNFNQQSGLFSFPYTDFQIRKSFFDKLNEEANLTFGTANLKLDSQKTNLQRIPMEIRGAKGAKNIIKNEYLYFVLKMLINKHIIIRN